MAYVDTLADVITVQSKLSLLLVNQFSIFNQSSIHCAMLFLFLLSFSLKGVVRRWLAIRNLAAVRIQCIVRVALAKKRFTEDRALYILVTRQTSSTKIQAIWRSYSAQVQMLISIVNIIVIQVSITIHDLLLHFSFFCSFSFPIFIMNF